MNDMVLPPPPAQDFAFSHFSRQYVSTVLQYRGVNKDLYHNLWQKVVSCSCTSLLTIHLAKSRQQAWCCGA